MYGFGGAMGTNGPVWGGVANTNFVNPATGQEIPNDAPKVGGRRKSAIDIDVGDELDEVGELGGERLGDTRRGRVGQCDDRDVGGGDDHEVRRGTQIEGAGVAEVHPAGR
jgi:hypothetical protein